MSEAPPESLDLPAYLRRVEYAGEREASPSVLEALHQAHATHIPFENLDIFLGRAIELDLASLQAKLVAGRRGGYCFEQNLLFSSVLQAFGFAVTQLAARVRRGNGVLLPRTHMMLEVEAGGRQWLADVGFGSDGLLAPVPLGTAKSRASTAGHSVSSTRPGSGCCSPLAAAPGRICTRSRRSRSFASTTSSRVTTRRRIRRRASRRSPPRSGLRRTCATRSAIATTARIVPATSSAARSATMTRCWTCWRETFGLRFPPGTRFRAPSSTISGNPHR